MITCPNSSEDLLFNFLKSCANLQQGFIYRSGEPFRSEVDRQTVGNTLCSQHFEGLSSPAPFRLHKFFFFAPTFFYALIPSIVAPSRSRRYYSTTPSLKMLWVPCPHFSCPPYRHLCPRPPLRRGQLSGLCGHNWTGCLYPPFVRLYGLVDWQRCICLKI